MKKFLGILAIGAVLALTTSAFAAMPTSAVVCDQAKVEMVKGHIVPGDTFHYVLKVAANSSTDSTNSTTSSCSVGSYNTTGELATSTPTGYTQGGLTSTGTWTLSSHSVNFTLGTAATWTAVSAAATFDTVEVYDATCTGCTNSNQLVAIFPISSFTGPTTGTYSVTPPSNMIVLTMDDTGIHWIDVASLGVSGSANINLPPLYINSHLGS
jgi:hypothetical protein